MFGKFKLILGVSLLITTQYNLVFSADWKKCYKDIIESPQTRGSGFVKPNHQMRSDASSLETEIRYSFLNDTFASVDEYEERFCSRFQDRFITKEISINYDKSVPGGFNLKKYITEVLPRGVRDWNWKDLMRRKEEKTAKAANGTKG